MRGPVQRLFAGEFNRSTAILQGTGPGGSSSLLTPTGLTLGRLTVVGALTEVEGRGGDLVHARVADPTGAFALRSGWHRPEVTAALAAIEPPAFIAVTGSPVLPARPSGHPPSLFPEAVARVDRPARDAWVIATADATLARLEGLHAALTSRERDPALSRAITEYRITPSVLEELAGMVATALASVERKGGQGAPTGADPKEVVLAYLGSRPKEAVPLDAILEAAVRCGIGPEEAGGAVKELMAEGECYMPRKGFYRLA